MTDWVVDTNVAIVANGHNVDGDDGPPPSVACRLAAVQFLQGLLKRHVVLLDSDGAIQTEYRTYLNPAGQPGVGDRFYQVVLHSSPDRVRRVDLPKTQAEEYLDLPNSLILAGFDPSDRKFAALANRENAPIANAVDSDWIEHAGTLAGEGIVVHNLCGPDPAHWFDQ